jgi:cytochrome P450
MGLKESVFPDAEKFKPERHLGDAAKAVNAFHMPIFQPGKRVCLGERFAYSEAKAVLVKLLSAYKLAPAPGQNTGLVHVNFVMRSEEDLHLLLEPRVPLTAIAAAAGPSS